MERYHNLANGIIIQAIKDYKYALKHYKDFDEHSREYFTILECERFFRSDWFKTLSNVDGETVISRIKERCNNERKPHTKHKKPNRNNF